jgi:hypothetical protein
MQMASELVGWKHFISWIFKLLLEGRTYDVVLEVVECWEIVFFYTQKN